MSSQGQPVLVLGLFTLLLRASVNRLCLWARGIPRSCDLCDLDYVAYLSLGKIWPLNRRLSHMSQILGCGLTHFSQFLRLRWPWGPLFFYGSAVGVRASVGDITGG